MKSQFLKLNLKDVVKGAVVAVTTGAGAYAALPSVVAQVTDSIPADPGAVVPTDGTTPSLAVTIICFLAYLAKNFFTNSKDELLKNETDKSL